MDLYRASATNDAIAFLSFILRGYADKCTEVQVYAHTCMCELGEGLNGGDKRVLNEVLPEPFASIETPNGVLLLMEKKSIEIFNYIKLDLQKWNAEATLRSLGMLYGAMLTDVSVLFAHLPDLAVILSKKIKHDNVEISSLIYKICDWIGQNLDCKLCRLIIELLARNDNDIISRKSNDGLNAVEAKEKVSYSLANLLTFISVCFSNLKSSVILDVRLDVLEAFLETDYVESFNDDIYASMLVVLDSLFCRSMEPICRMS